ncbi:ArnT family glycosyltransferase [Agaribacter marinus]|uniref:Phospholipid carrier-dependent glycosyltransferase n=1 Tax=Agaribacter marinus TaxID=1431249 RepID=A0AA37T1J5_9ALTE|nr:glycosyltransferase family 39 protein [Agaribacter marinus]GLR70030.1 phospholipid carrier-dependent glycosyltransferase [Agaribacter marinus]
MGNRTHLVDKYSVALLLILVLLLIRFFSLSALPLYDTTEARYAEIARIMFETNNWVTPMIDYEKPFWGKPPFHTWLSASGFMVFGVSEFGARIPHFACGLITLFLVFRFVKEMNDEKSAVLAVLVLASSIGFIVGMGMVMTDIALLLSTSVAMISFWKTYADSSDKFYGLIFFASLALGMLVKGPVAIVLVAISLGVWSIWQGQLIKALTCLPWLTGVSLFALLTLPWYLMAEYRTPGFLEYFIIGEHFQRFIVSGWEGDLYGSAHDQPRGTIWIYWLVAAFPWSFVLITSFIQRMLVATSETRCSPSGFNAYLICWMIAPMLLFTLSGNILSAYVLPGFSAMSILIALTCQFQIRHLTAAALTVVLLATLLGIYLTGNVSKSSELHLLGRNSTTFESTPLYYWQHRPFSAQYYSNGNAKLLANTHELQQVIDAQGDFFLAIEDKHLTLIKTPHLKGNCTEILSSNIRQLLFCKGDREKR